jgi:3-phenylpropionate/cinnamic acid dioxygenase small subunit
MIEDLTSDLMLLDQYEGGSLEEKLSSFFTTMKTKLDTRFFKILTGRYWVEIPTDWHGYK